MRIPNLLSTLIASVIAFTSITAQADQLANIKKKVRLEFLACWALMNPIVL